MKLLLDEQMPRKIYRLFPSDYVISNVQAEGWAGVQNGELLELAHAKGFDALISAVLVLHVPRLRIEELEPLIPKAVEQLEKLSARAFIQVGV